MAPPERALGSVVGDCTVHVVPSYSHVSCSVAPPESLPPNKRTLPLTGSNAMAWPPRADGELKGTAGSQLVPFHSHVSLCFPVASSPPNSTVTCRTASYASAWF